MNYRFIDWRRASITFPLYHKYLIHDKISLDKYLSIGRVNIKKQLYISVSCDDLQKIVDCYNDLYRAEILEIKSINEFKNHVDLFLSKLHLMDFL